MTKEWNKKQPKLVDNESDNESISESDVLRCSTAGDAYDMCNKYSVPMSFTVVSNRIEGPKATCTFVEFTRWPIHCN